MAYLTKPTQHERAIVNAANTHNQITNQRNQIGINGLTGAGGSTYETLMIGGILSMYSPQWGTPCPTLITSSIF